MKQLFPKLCRREFALATYQSLKPNYGMKTAYDLTIFLFAEDRMAQLIAKVKLKANHIRVEMEGNHLSIYRGIDCADETDLQPTTSYVRDPLAPTTSGFEVKGNKELH